MSKGQIKMFETTAVLIVFFFLMAISIIFYYNMSFSNQQNELVEIRRINSFQNAVRTFFMPELDCSFGGVKVYNCYDVLKLEKFSELFNTDNDFRGFYVQMFGTSLIKVDELYPNSKTLILYNFTPEKFDNKLNVFSPVLLYDPNGKGSCLGLTGSCSFGIVEVAYYD